MQFASPSGPSATVVAHERWAASPAQTSWMPQGSEAGAVVESLRDRERQIQREREELLRMKAALSGEAPPALSRSAVPPTSYLSTSRPQVSSQVQTPPQVRSSSDGATGHVANTFGEDVASLFARYESILRQVFSHYDSSGSGMLSMADIVRMARGYDITPTFISRKEIRDAFDSALTGSRGGLNYGQFICALGHIASISLSKPMFAHLYKTTASKVNVMLTMWGVGDASKLSEVRSR